MTQPTTFACPTCGATYKLQGLAAGKKVKCRKCEAVIEVPAATQPEREEPPVAPTAPASFRTGSGRRTERAARARGRTERETPKKKSNMPLIAGAAGLLVVAAVAVFLITSRGSGNSSAAGRGNEGGSGAASPAVNSPGAGSATPTPPAAGNQGAPAREKPAPEKTPREQFLDHLAQADKASDASAKTKHLMDAVGLLEQTRIAEAGFSPEDLYRKVIAIDADHAAAHKALGHLKYDGDYDKYKGKWLTRDEMAAAQKEWQALLAERKKEEAAEAEKARWTKDGFARKCGRVRDFFDKDVSQVPNLKLKYFFDLPEVPRPYILVVEDAENPDPEATAKILGPGLGALREQFFGAYKDIAFESGDKLPVPVLIFKETKSYENYRDHGHKFFPSTGLAAAFYTHRAVPDAFRGILYVWQGADEHRFYREVFHEATHQLMHTASAEVGPISTPWLQEGIAEFWGAYLGNRHEGYRFRQFLGERFSVISDLAKTYNTSEKKEGLVDLQRLLGMNRLEFERAKALLDQEGKGSPAQRGAASDLLQATYGLGWAFIFFSHQGPTGEEGKYIDAFRKVLADEMRGEFTFEKLADYYGLKTEDDWETLNKSFFLFCQRRMRQWNNGQPVPDLPKGK